MDLLQGWELLPDPDDDGSLQIHDHGLSTTLLHMDYFICPHSYSPKPFILHNQQFPTYNFQIISHSSPKLPSPSLLHKHQQGLIHLLPLQLISTPFHQTNSTKLD
ncbi:UNVERIFIED_CONTAM: hypothetical protein Sangu_0786100 [Sesamum angustifolium]|uniref:Uncharacterized protein n=1 Tax=Sesamum angustifolium TaxID=2727405 RepID=A0AAW2PV68_9LAMI